MTLPNIGKPATNALNQLGIFDLKDLRKIDEENLVKIHGVGPTAHKILMEAMKEKRLTFKEAEPLPFSTPFAVLGDLSCNNAPKREIIRNFIIALHKGKSKDFEHLKTSTCEVDIPLAGEKINCLSISTIITHGKDGALDGIVYLNSGQIIPFAYFIEFDSHKKNALIKEVKRYHVN